MASSAPHHALITASVRETLTNGASANRDELDQMRRLVQTLLDHSTEGIMIEDARRRISMVNPVLERLLETSESDLIGQPSDFFRAMIPEGMLELIREALMREQYWQGEMIVTVPTGRQLPGRLTVNAVTDARRTTMNYVILFTDLSEMRESRRQLQLAATHDALTELPNRALFFDKLQTSVRRVTQEGVRGALFCIDLDRFKEINDNFGHRAGDAVLHEVAGRLRQVIAPSDLLGRIGGDEFGIISERIGSVEEAVALVHAVRQQFAVPFAVGKTEVAVGASIGIAFFPDDADNAEDLVLCADRAMQGVKTAGRSGYEIFSQQTSAVAREYFQIQRALREALGNRAFSIVYQPQFSVTRGRLTGMEALLRCHDPRVREVPIGELITLAEESNFICDIGRYVLVEVCAQIARWREHLELDLVVAVNLSRKELGSEALVDEVRRSLRTFEVDPTLLEFEITESTFMRSGTIARANIAALRALGCRFSIDDFGTGYSSLANLKEFDLDKLKIDKSFIDNLLTEANDQIIVQATISMAKKLGLRVLAEGVEMPHQIRLLKAFGCDEIQGFMLGRPQNVVDMTRLLTRHYRIVKKGKGSA